MGWLQKLFGKRSEKPKCTEADLSAPTADELARVIPAFGRVLERHASYGMAVFDVTTLPVPKARLEAVLLCAIGIVEDEQQARQIAAAMVSLADYQVNVRPSPFTMVPELPRLGPEASPDAVKANAAAVVHHSSTGRYHQFRPLIEADQVRLRRMIDRAMTMREAHKSKRGGR